MNFKADLPHNLLISGGINIRNTEEAVWGSQYSPRLLGETSKLITAGCSQIGAEFNSSV